MAGKLIVDTLEPEISSGVVEVNGKFQAQSIMGAMKPYNTTWKRTITGQTDDSIDFGLGDSDAKFVMVTAYSYCNYSSTDFVCHVFGSSIPGYDNSTIYNDSYYNFVENDNDSYVVFTVYGGAGNAHAGGVHQFLVIPLKDDKTIDAKLCLNYDHGTHYIKLRTIGYIE